MPAAIVLALYVLKSVLRTDVRTNHAFEKQAREATYPRLSLYTWRIVPIHNEDDVPSPSGRKGCLMSSVSPVSLVPPLLKDA